MKYINLLDNITPDANYEPNLEQVCFGVIIQIEKELAEIKDLYEENIFLKNMNNQIKKRIR